MPRFVLVLSCPDQLGIVADVSGFLVGRGCNIVDSAQHSDAQNGMFFMRTTFQALRGAEVSELTRAFVPIANKFNMHAEFHCEARKVRTLLLVSKFGHCLNDLLFRRRIGALPVEVVAIVSNHRDFEDTARASSIDFHYMPVDAESKVAQEKALVDLVKRRGVELIVLARYMQVLSEELCERYSGRIINIHHSFLPSFKGGRPYQQAHMRGVKLIGATAHYVTKDLDEGPIIEQSVERVSHSQSIDDFISIGRDVESVVLARAVKWHAEHRVLLNGNRTIVFS